MKFISPKTAAIVEKFYHATDLSNELSYANGVTDMASVKKTNQNIRLKTENKTDEDRIIYIAPSQILGIDVTSSTSFEQINVLLAQLGLPEGVPFVKGTLTEEEGKTLKIESMNRDQHLQLLAGELKNTPTQIIGISLSSYNVATGNPESSNTGNTITVYNVSSLRPRKYKDMNLGAFMSRKDNNTNVLHVDFIANNFTCTVSQNDLFAFQVNKGTRLEVTLHIGARDSRAEYHHRQVEGGTKMILDNFPEELARDCSC